MANEERSSIEAAIIDTVQHRNAIGVAAKVVVENRTGRAAPDGPGILESANQFPFLGVDADHSNGAMLPQVTHESDVLELLVALRVVATGNLLVVHTQPIVELSQPPGHGGA